MLACQNKRKKRVYSIYRPWSTGGGGSRRSSHPQQTHLPSQWGRSGTALLTGIAGAIGIDIPVRLGIVAATLACGRAITRLKALLHRSTCVPTERARDAVEPLCVGACDGWEGILRSRDGHAVARLQLDATLAVKGTVGGGARVTRHRDAEEHGVGEDHGSEGEGVRADRGEKDSGDVRVDEGTACGEGVGC